MANVYASKIKKDDGSQKKKRRNLIIIITVAVLVVLTAIILPLSLIKVKVYNRFSVDGFTNPEYIRIYSSGNTNTQGKEYGKDATPQNKAKYDEILQNFKAGDFTVMRGWLEGKFNVGLKSTLEYDNEDEPDLITNAIIKTDLENLCSQSSSSKLLIEFFYAQKQTVKTKDVEIKYNTIMFFIENNGNEITSNQIYFFDKQEWNDEDYETYVVHFLLNTYPLHSYISEKLL